MENLRKKLLSLKTADADALGQLEGLFNPLRFRKNSILVDEFGFPSATLYYISHGLMRGVVSEDGTDYSLWIADEGFVIPGNGFLSGTGTGERIEVLADMRGYSLNLLRADTIARNNVNLYRMLLEIYEEALASGRKRETMLRMKKAADRYRYFRENFPSLHHKLTVGQQAEYLHIERKYLYSIRRQS